MPSALARSASAWPIIPMPTIPSRWSISDGVMVLDAGVHSPALSARSPETICRRAAMIRPSAWSATSSWFTAGAWET